MKTRIAIIAGCIAAAIVIAVCTLTTTRSAAQPVAIDIAPNGRLSVAGHECRRSELVAKLTELAAKQPTGVLIRVDAATRYEHVVTVLDACETARVQQVKLTNTR